MSNAEPGDAPTLNLHAVVTRSRANGPGERIVLWTQGCDLGCPGCFNPQTHGFEPARILTVSRCADHVVANAPDLDGLTVSGGEPFAQARALRALLAEVRARTTLSVLVFSGHTLAEIEADTETAAVLEHVDVLVAGRYAAKRRAGRALLGSANQRIHLLSDRHTLDQMRSVPECELHLARDGTVTVTGIAPQGAAPRSAELPPPAGRAGR